MPFVQPEAEPSALETPRAAAAFATSSRARAEISVRQDPRGVHAAPRPPLPGPDIVLLQGDSFGLLGELGPAAGDGTEEPSELSCQHHVGGRAGRQAA